MVPAAAKALHHSGGEGSSNKAIAFVHFQPLTNRKRCQLLPLPLAKEAHLHCQPSLEEKLHLECHIEIFAVHQFLFRSHPMATSCPQPRSLSNHSLKDCSWPAPNSKWQLLPPTALMKRPSPKRHSMHARSSLTFFNSAPLNYQWSSTAY